MTVTSPPLQSCSALALERAEPLFATAPHTSGWLAVEQPGAWRRNPFATGLADEIHRALLARADAGGLRLLAMRPLARSTTSEESDARPASADTAGARARRIVEADCRPGRVTLWSGVAASDGELLDVVDPSRHPDPDERRGVVAVPPLYLVCTHAGRDACCGRDGRTVALALAAARPGRVWECSHLGGHRFAANVLVLPLGLVYGRVRPADAAALADTTDRGEVEPRLLRGRCASPPAAQAAEHFLRLETGLRGSDDLTSERLSAAPGSAVTTVTVRHGPLAWEVGVRAVPVGARPVSCVSSEEEDPGGYELVSIDERPVEPGHGRSGCGQT